MPFFFVRRSSVHCSRTVRICYPCPLPIAHCIQLRPSFGQHSICHYVVRPDSMQLILLRMYLYCNILPSYHKFTHCYNFFSSNISYIHINKCIISYETNVAVLYFQIFIVLFCYNTIMYSNW